MHPGIGDVEESKIPSQLRDALRIACLSRLVPRKNIDLLIYALPELATKFQSVTLDIVGDGPERESLAQLAERLPNTCSVHLHGYLSDEEVSRVLQNAHVFALPSIKEGFGIAYLEALREGLPLVGTMSQGAPEAIGRAGICIAELSPQTVADAIAEAVAFGQSPEFQKTRLEHLNSYSYSAFEERVFEILPPLKQ